MNGRDVSSIYRDAPSCQNIIVLDVQKRQPQEDLGCARAIHAMCAGQTTMYPGSFNRVWWWLAGDQAAAVDEPQSWLEAQICLQTQMSQGDADARALEIAKASVASSQFEVLANCLDGCSLSADMRKTVEQLEAGRGYEARYGKQIAAISSQLGASVSVQDVNAVLFRASEVRQQMTPHKDRVPTFGDLIQRLTTLETESKNKLPTLATAELDRYVADYAASLKILHDAATSKADIDETSIAEAMESARRAIGNAVSAFPSYREQGWLGTRVDGYSKQFEVASAQFDKDSKIVSTRLERQRKIASTRGQLCNASRSLDELKKAEDFQRRVDSESGTSDLAAKRRNATAKVFLQDQRKKLLADLKALKATFDAKRNCGG